MRRLSAVVTDEEYKRVDRLVRAGAARSVAEFVRHAVSEYAKRSGALKLVNLREVPLPVAKTAVERYLRKHSGVVWPDQMAEELGIDYRVVLTVVRELLQEGKLEEAMPRVEEIGA